MNIDLEQKIRERAYQIWEREGRAHGRDQDHWHAARRELASLAQNTSRDTSAIAVPSTAADGAKKPRKRAAPVAAKPELAAPKRRRTPARLAP
jgi:hypothetical protein